MRLAGLIVAHVLQAGRREGREASAMTAGNGWRGAEARRRRLRRLRARGGQGRCWKSTAGWWWRRRQEMTVEARRDDDIDTDRRRGYGEWIGRCAIRRISLNLAASAAGAVDRSKRLLRLYMRPVSRISHPGKYRPSGSPKRDARS